MNNGTHIAFQEETLYRQMCDIQIEWINLTSTVGQKILTNIWNWNTVNIDLEKIPRSNAFELFLHSRALNATLYCHQLDCLYDILKMRYSTLVITGRTQRKDVRPNNARLWRSSNRCSVVKFFCMKHSLPLLHRVTMDYSSQWRTPSATSNSTFW